MAEDGAADGQPSRGLERLYTTLSRTNRALARASSEHELLDEICRIAVDHGGFVLATVGLVSPDGWLRTLVGAGPAHGYTDDLRIARDAALAEGRGPGGHVLRTGEPVVLNDFLEDERSRAWHERARRFGIRSSVALPLIGDGPVIGVFGVYSANPGHFGAREVALLEDIAIDIGLGLAARARVAALEQITAERARLLEQLRAISLAARVGVFRITLPDWSLWWTGVTSAVADLSPGVAGSWEVLGAVVGAGGLAALRTAIEEAAHGQAELDLDLAAQRRDGSTQWLRISGRAQALPDGGTEVNGVIEDVSDRRLLAVQLEHAAAVERQRLVSDLHDNLGQVLTAGAYLAAAFRRRAGREAPALAADATDIEAAFSDAQKLCRDLSHGMLDDLGEGLTHALGKLATRTTAAGVRCTFRSSAVADDDLSREQCLELYRIAQEGVTNALKHARCRLIEIELAREPDAIALEVRDDGVGIDPARLSDGLGMRTMRYRAARLGATVAIGLSGRAGTRVRLAVPAEPRRG